MSSSSRSQYLQTTRRGFFDRTTNDDSIGSRTFEMQFGFAHRRMPTAQSGNARGRFSATLVAGHVHGGRRRDERDLIELPTAELAVFDLHDVFPTHRLTRHVHRDGHRRRHGVPDPEDLEHLQREPRRDMVDHGPVLDRGDAELPHAPSPRIRSRSAIRTGTALKACLKYTACFVRSTSGAISVTRGSGCMMMSPRFASLRISISMR